MKNRQLILAIPSIVVALLILFACSQQQTTPPVQPRTPTFLPSTPNGSLPTSTLEADSDVSGPVMTIGPLKIMTPSAEWATYTDPNLGFSVQYPDNWQLEPPTGLTPAQALAGGTSVTIRNATGARLKGAPSEEELAITVMAIPELLQYGSLDNWVAQRVLFDEPNYSAREVVNLSENRALRWTATGPTIPEGIVLVAAGKGKWIYLIEAFPATSRYLETFNKIVSTVRIPYPKSYKQKNAVFQYRKTAFPIAQTSRGSA